MRNSGNSGKRLNADDPVAAIPPPYGMVEFFAQTGRQPDPVRGVSADGCSNAPGTTAGSRRLVFATSRNIRPYMHEGSLATLRDVVEFYNRGGNRNPGLSGRLRPFGLADVDRPPRLFPQQVPENS